MLCQVTYSKISGAPEELVAVRSMVPLLRWANAAPWPQVGVDVVSLDRIDRAGELAVRRFTCGEQELAALDSLAYRGPDDSLRMTAATWAVKESAIKAAGGRPDGFSWTSIYVAHDRGSIGQLATFLGDAIRDITGSSACHWCRYEWRLPAPGAHGMAAWCTADSAVWAIAVQAPTDIDCARRGW